jgi:hypothetical protein
MPEVIKIPFGMADITIGEGAEAIKFDGKEFLQADGGEVTLTPITTEIKMADLGESVYDEIIVGYEGTVKFVAGQDSIKVLQNVLSYTDAITDTATSTTVGLMDAKIGTSMRSRAKKVTVHPRALGTSLDFDINIYKMASTSGFVRSYGNEQGKQEVEMKVYPRDGFDPAKPGNFFYIGPKDPNVVV